MLLQLPEVCLPEAELVSGHRLSTRSGRPLNALASCSSTARMLYLNVGDRARAEEYYRRKLADGLPGVQLKSSACPSAPTAS